MGDDVRFQPARSLTKRIIFGYPLGKEELEG